MPRIWLPNMFSIWPVKPLSTSVSSLLTASPWLPLTDCTASEMRASGSFNPSFRLEVIDCPSWLLVAVMVAICWFVSSVSTCLRSVTSDSFICIACVAEVSAASTRRCRYSSPAPASNRLSITPHSDSSSM